MDRVVGVSWQDCIAIVDSMTHSLLGGRKSIAPSTDWSDRLKNKSTDIAETEKQDDQKLWLFWFLLLERKITSRGIEINYSAA